MPTPEKAPDIIKTARRLAATAVALENACMTVRLYGEVSELNRGAIRALLSRALRLAKELGIEVEEVRA
jgi:2'-5' RNA ligase